MEEYGSEGLDDLIKKEANGYFKNVDCVCISDKWALDFEYRETPFIVSFPVVTGWAKIDLAWRMD